jgi:uncharacterized protein YecE (DUF72 family)
MASKVYVGTSGWHYKHWLRLFYPEKLPAKDMLPFYARQFDTVEINNSFYHLPLSSTFDSWRESAPRDFLFAVKGSRFTTHMKKLKDPVSSTQRFFAGVERLERKLGPILFQLPPRWKVNKARLKSFLAALPRQHKYAFEFRDETWLVNEIYEVLHEYKAAFCIHDLARMQTPLQVTADFTYIRLHGPGAARYQGSYSTQVLRKWADRIRDWRRNLSAVYVYFNNDIGGKAIENAKTLKRMVDG